MLRRYREIFYGLLLGIGASLIDTLMHARMEERSLWAELVHPQPGMAFYRFLYVAFGVAVGLSLWQKSKRERDYRKLLEVFDEFHQQIAGPAFLIQAKLEVLLMREDLSAEAIEHVRFAYEKSQAMQSLIKERLPRPSQSWKV